MEEIAISKFRATCFEVLERVRKTRKAVLVTRFGVPVAEVTPHQSQNRKGTGWVRWREPLELKEISSRRQPIPTIGKASINEACESN